MIVLSKKAKRLLQAAGWTLAIMVAMGLLAALAILWPVTFILVAMFVGIFSVVTVWMP